MSKEPVEKEETEEESWNRFPKAKVRMVEKGLERLLDGLGKDGMCITDRARIQLLDDGVYITMMTNTGKNGNVLANSIEVFIPVPAAMMPKALPDDEDETPEIAPVGAVKAGPEDIKMASDGSLGGTTGLSSGLGEGDGGSLPNGERPSVSSDGLQPSVGTDVVDSQPVAT